MKAVLDRDIILQAGVGDSEIGNLPRGVGLERLRWDGSQIIDLMNLASIWVEERAGVFVLHAVEVPGSMEVAMTYADRRRLMNDGGTIRLKTPAEIAAEEEKEAADRKHTRLMTGMLRDTDRALILDVIKLLYAFIIAQRQPNAQLRAWLDSQLSDMGTTFQWASERPRMEKLIDALKARMTNFYAE